MRCLLVICFSAMLLAGCAPSEPHALHGKVYEPPTAAPELALTDHNAQPFQLATQRGKVVLLFFGYTHCPDVCPTALSEMKHVRQKLGADAERVKVIFVAVDPERDTTQVLARYIASFDPSFIGLRGSQGELAPVLRDYRVKVERVELPNSALGYAINHSSYIFVIDKAGQLRQRLLLGAEDTDEIAGDVRYLLGQ